MVLRLYLDVGIYVDEVKLPIERVQTRIIHPPSSRLTLKQVDQPLKPYPRLHQRCLPQITRESSPTSLS